MAVTAFYTVFMAGIVWFFGLAGHTDSPAHWAYAAAMLALFWRMVHTRQYSRWRRVFLVSFAVLFAVSFMGILYDERGSMALTAETVASGEVPFCHIVIPVILAPFALTGKVIFPARMAGHFASVTGMVLIWFIATVTVGRGWCGWACFYGGWEEGFSRLRKRPLLETVSRNREVRTLHYAFLFFVLLASLSLLSSVYCEWFCPFKLVTEFAEITNAESLVAAVLFIGLFLFLVVAMPILTGKRTQCSSLCPFGSFQSLLSPLSLFSVSIDPAACVGCMKCARACPFFAIDERTITEGLGKPERNCALCGECVSVCPSGAIRYEIRPLAPKRGKAGPRRVSPAAGPVAAGPAGRFLRSLLEAEYLFAFTAFTFSVMLSGKFVPDALTRIARLLAGGIL